LNKIIIAVLLFATPAAARNQNFEPENAGLTIFLMLVMLGVAVVGVIVAMNAGKAAADPNDKSFASALNLGNKLSERIRPNSLYHVSVIRQSGNIEREYQVQGTGLAAQVEGTVRRASMDPVRIIDHADGFEISRVVRNDRSRQEGKRIGNIRARMIR
jgi:hypothetical protein